MRKAGFRGVLVVAAVAAIGLSACGSSQPSDGSSSSAGYKVAVVADLTGAGSAIGLAWSGGVQTYLDGLNKAGGIGGHKVSVSVIDSQSTVVGTETGIRQALGDNADAILNWGVSSDVAAAAPALSDQNVPFVTATSLDPFLVPKPKSWYFAMTPDSKQEMSAIISSLEGILHGSLSGKTIAVVGGESASIDEWIGYLQQEATADGAKIVSVTRTPLTIAEFSGGPTTAIVAKAPDAVVDLGSPAAIVTVAKGLFSAGLKVPVISQPGGDFDSTFQAVGSADYYSIRESREPAPGSSLAEAAAHAGFGSVSASPFFTDGWVAAYLVAQGLHRCGSSCTAGKLLKTLNDFGTVTAPSGSEWGPIGFSASDHVVESAVQAYGWDPASGTAKAVGSPVVINPQ
jgi:ABC-type branched-subunit amino acid transport system substrate-binding protein